MAGTRTGVIAGQVRLPSGEPVAGIRVAAMEAPEMGNQDAAVSTMAGLTTTDATGHYRLEDIPVGKYFVVAGSLDNLSYYPGSITVTSVAPTENVDFSLSDSYEGVIDVRVHLVGAVTPVSRSDVRIRSTSSTFSRNLETNDKGIASFSGIPYGDYVVSTTMILMADALAGGSSSAIRRDLSVTVTINPNRPKWAVSLGLLRPGVIRGTVRQSNGTPAADVSVSSMNPGYQDGRRTLVSESTTRTNARGEYELPASPGEHFIRATAEADTFYPSTVDSTAAKTAGVGNGEVASGYDIALVRTSSIRGRIADLPADSSPPSFVLVSRSGRDAVVPSVRLPEAGTFEISGVPAGSWDLFAVTGSGIPELHQTGKVRVDVDNKDVDGVMISMNAVELRGRITGLGTETGTVRLVPVDAIDGALVDAVPGLEFPSPEGEFAFANIPALRYRVEVNGLPPAWYVADIRMGTASVFNENVVTVGTMPLAPLEIAVARGAGTLQGTVDGITPNTRLTNARVVLVPDEPRRQNLLLYRTATIQANGTFAMFPNPAPGSYKMFAVSNLPAGHAEWNAEFLKKYDDVAVPITVRPNQPTSIKLDLTPAR